MLPLINRQRLSVVFDRFAILAQSGEDDAKIRKRVRTVGDGTQRRLIGFPRVLQITLFLQLNTAGKVSLRLAHGRALLDRHTSYDQDQKQTCEHRVLEFDFAGCF